METNNTYALNIITNLFYASFLLLAIIAIGYWIFTQKKVDIDVVNGGLCVFLLLGLLWFNLYHLLLIIDPDALQGLSTGIDRNYQVLFFSFATITTLGYRDIIPINPFAMMLANAEAMIGMMYPAIFIARLVSLYTSQENEINHHD